MKYHLHHRTVNIATQLKDLMEDNTKVFTPESIDQLVKEAAHGNLQAVKDIIIKNPNVNFKHSSINCIFKNKLCEI